MRKNLLLIGMAVALTTWSVAHAQDNQANQEKKAAAAAQNPASDTPGEKNLPDVVDIKGTPEVKTSNHSATINWQTNNTAATDVWLEGGGIDGHLAQFNAGGKRDHTVTFDKLKPNTTYTYKIRSGKGEVRYEGTLTTVQ